MLICTGRRPTTECHQHKCATLPLVQLEKSAFPRKKAARNWTNVMVDHKTLSEGCFECCQVLCIGIDKIFTQLWGKTVALIGWFHTIDGQCTSVDLFVLIWMNSAWAENWSFWCPVSRNSISFHFVTIHIYSSVLSYQYTIPECVV